MKAWTSADELGGGVKNSLAWAELYLAIANLLTQFDIENAGTTEQDMQWRDRLITVPDGHLRVLLRAKSV